MPEEIAIPGTHAKVLKWVRKLDAGPRVLDIGAGHGALSEGLAGLGKDVAACDVLPQLFQAQGIECRPIDTETGVLPFDDASFDMAFAVEVVEHIDGHMKFFAEVSRVLKPGGVFIFTTPNILSLKSRLRFLMTGYYYSFGPLQVGVLDPVHQHLSPSNVDRYRWMLSQNHLHLDELRTDKYQTSSMLLWPFLGLPGWCYSKLKFGDATGAQLHRSAAATLGRKLMARSVKMSSVD